MSCSYDIGCKTCDVTSGLLDENHGGEALAALCGVAPQLAALANVKARSGAARWFLEDRIGTRVLFSLAEFFALHAGHDLRPRDEYGRWYDQCRDWYVCPTCEHRHPCALDQGHDGAHSPKAVT
jgi:hypothetical protein